MNSEDDVIFEMVSTVFLFVSVIVEGVLLTLLLSFSIRSEYFSPETLMFMYVYVLATIYNKSSPSARKQ